MERISKEHKYRIENNQSYLETNLDGAHFTSDFIEMGLFDGNDREEIDSISRPNMRTKKFLSYLLDRGRERHYNHFLNRLETDDHHVFLLINNTVVPEEVINPWGWFETVDERIKSHEITDSDCSRFSNCLGKGWEDFLLHLGIQQNEIDIEKVNHRDNMCKNIRHLLISWTHRQETAATVRILIDKMKEYEYDGDLVIYTCKLKSALSRI